MDLASIETSAQTRLASDETTPHHIAQPDLTVRIVCARPEAEVLALAEDARKHCPVCNVLGSSANVTLAVTLEVAGAAVS